MALVTTKPDKENHGRGVKSIRKVVDKYDGTIEFEDKGDVFADIYNTLLFGKQLLVPEQLFAGSTESIYKSAKDQWKEQRRDTVKEYMNCVNLTIATLGIENQSTIDENEPIRVMGYDYGSYRQQIVDEKKLHPVITIVLNFTDKIWSGKKSLLELLEIPSDFEGFVQDYKINVFDIAYLEDEIIETFTSDFKLVSRFFKNKRLGLDAMNDDTTEMKHPEELMELLSVFTGDSSYEKVIPEILERKKKGEVITMCTVAQGLMEKGRTEQITKDIMISINRYRKLGLDNETIRNIIMEDYQLDEQESDDFLRK